VRGVRRDAGGGAGAHRVRLPRLRYPAGAPAGAHAAPPAAPAPGASHPWPRSRRRRCACARARARARGTSAREFAVRRLRRAAERAGRPRALRMPSLRRRAHCRRRASPSIPRLPAPPHCLGPGAAPSRHYFEFEAIPTLASRGAYLVF
jgi:hypothetical protein